MSEHSIERLDRANDRLRYVDLLKDICNEESLNQYCALMKSQYCLEKNTAECRGNTDSRVKTSIIDEEQLTLPELEEKILIYLSGKIGIGTESTEPVDFDVEDFCRSCGIRKERYGFYRSQIIAAIDRIASYPAQLFDTETELENEVCCFDYSIKVKNGTVIQIYFSPLVEKFFREDTQSV